MGSPACGCVEENPHIETERQEKLHAAYPESILACRTSCKDRLQRNGASTPQRNVSALSGMTHFTKRVRWWWAGLGFGAWSGKVRGGCHGSFRPEGAGRSALRAARVASGSFVQNPLPGTQNVGLQGMPRIWTGCGTALESVMSGVGWALFGPRFEDRTSSLEKPSFGWAILGPHAGALGGWAGAGICGWYR